MTAPDNRRPARPARREPRLVPFLVSGAVLGFVAGWALAVLRDDAAPAFGQRTAGISVQSTITYLGLFGAFVGTLLAALLYLLADRRSSR